MTTTPDESALLAAIAAHPGEDTPRLMYADLIVDEQPERAEFIRLQIWISQQQHPHDVCPGCGYEPADGYHHNSPDCPYARVDDLFTAHGASWSNAIVDRVNPQTQTSTVHIGGVNIRIGFTRGFAETLYMPTLADLCQERTRQFSYGRANVPGDYTGKPTQLALDIMRAHPTITRVVAGDTECYEVGGRWFLRNGHVELLPEFFIEKMERQSFKNQQAALDALAVAAGQWLRSHTGESQ